MGNRTVKIPAVLHGRLEALAKEKGYSSAEELIRHVLEKAVDGASHDEDVEAVKRQLKGLGYFNG